MKASEVENREVEEIPQTSKPFVVIPTLQTVRDAVYTKASAEVWATNDSNHH